MTPTDGMQKLSIGTAVFSLIVFALTVLPGFESAATVESERIPEGRAGSSFRKIQQSYELVHEDSLVAPIVAGESYDALATYLADAKGTLKRLRNFKENPSQADRRADVDFGGVETAACDSDLLAAVRRGERDRWGRLTATGRKAGLPPCSAESRREAFADSLEKTVDNAAFMANAYRENAHVFRVELRIAAGLGLAASAFGFFGGSTMVFVLLLAAGLIPFGYRTLAAGSTWISFFVLPLYVAAAIGSLYVESDAD